MVPNNVHTYLECECSDLQHLCRATVFWTPELSPQKEKQLYLSIAAAPYRGFWARLWYAIKYVFKSTSIDDYPYAEVILSEGSAREFKFLLEAFLVEERRKQDVPGMTDRRGGPIVV